jgi:ketosteroid isomerase-like protein
MISKLLVPFVAAAFCAAQTPATKATEAVTPGAQAQIRSVLERQTVDWNRGDTDGFLLGYDPKVVFVGEKITRGLDEVRVRYQTHYPTRASMGTLTFSDLEIQMIDASNALVIGRWRLQRNAEGGGDTGGVFTLLFRKTAKGWKIVVDHTS